MDRLVNILRIALASLVGLIVILLFLPIMIVLIPFNYYSDRRRERVLKRYLVELGNKNFFCYNNRSDAKDFIENELIPKLNKKIELIYLNGRVPESEYTKDHISLLLYKLKNYSRFPHLLKIRDGQVIDESINNEFFNAMNQNKPVDDVMAKINAFFDLA